ncbi:selenium-binding protein SBP56-related protein [Salinisphaera sp. SPP-AMP-43]|uniref:selenium-binding protein SBP56-related protein n=1 Tax=Salinisphaera sp. SPP-AMP-43 TaxID=3121288 RepID=UPI003C6E7A50
MAAQLRPDKTFYPSPRLAMAGPRERYGFVATLCPNADRPDAIVVVDLDPESPHYATVVHRIDMPNVGDELHHFGWNACSSMLGPQSCHPFVTRRYLIVPGLRSSRLHIIDTHPSPTEARLVRTIEADELAERTGYSRPHTIHCGPEGVYVSALGGMGAEGADGPAGIFLMDCDSLDILGQWEIERGDQELHYDFWWHIAHDIAITSEWGKPPLFEQGLVPEALLAHRYGHRIHFWDLAARRLRQTIDLGAQHQMALEVRPAHDPREQYGFVGVVIDTTSLAASVWTWYREGDVFQIEKTIEIPAVPAAADQLPELLKGFEAVPPLVTDIDLSLDDRYLYVACWGTGELRQYDVSDPRAPCHNGTIEIGGIATHRPHSNGQAFGGGPQMVEISRDGRRVYVTNSLYSSWDDQFYPDGVPGVAIKADIADDGTMQLDPAFCVDFGPNYRAHQIRLDGGDCSTESFAFP